MKKGACEEGVIEEDNIAKSLLERFLGHKQEFKIIHATKR